MELNVNLSSDLRRLCQNSLHNYSSIFLIALRWNWQPLANFDWLQKVQYQIYSALKLDPKCHTKHDKIQQIPPCQWQLSKKHWRELSCLSALTSKNEGRMMTPWWSFGVLATGLTTGNADLHQIKTWLTVCSVPMSTDTTDIPQMLQPWEWQWLRSRSIRIPWDKARKLWEI